MVCANEKDGNNKTPKKVVCLDTTGKIASEQAQNRGKKKH